MKQWKRYYFDLKIKTFIYSYIYLWMRTVIYYLYSFIIYTDLLFILVHYSYESRWIKDSSRGHIFKTVFSNSRKYVCICAYTIYIYKDTNICKYIVADNLPSKHFNLWHENTDHISWIYIYIYLDIYIYVQAYTCSSSKYE